MKTSLKFAMLLLLCTHFAISQEIPKIKFGKITEEELKMKVYAPDTTAAAVILFDDGASSVTYDVTLNRFMLTFDRFVRVKILKESGKEWGNYNISLYSFNQTKEELRGIDGVTFNLENGKIEKSSLKKDGIFKERDNKYWEVAKISLPAVKVGSVIDLKYSIFSPLLWNLQPWKFQYSIPVQWSHLSLKYPEYFKYNHSTFGYHRLFKTDSGTRIENINYTETDETGRQGLRRETVMRTISYTANTFDYVAKEIPAIKEEPFCSTLDNYITRIKFELASTNFTMIGGSFKNYTNTWESINNDLLADEDFGGQISGGNFVEDDVKKLTSGLTAEKDKMISLYSFVQKNIKWDKYKSYLTSQPVRKAFNEKTGNSADINLLLLVMLQKAGISADPVIISTRDHGIINPAHPSISDCNYVIVRAMIDNKPVFLDATDPQIPAGQLPLRCMNGNGYVIRKTSPMEIPLTVTPSSSTTSVLLDIKDGKLKGTVVSRHSGLEAYNFRTEIKDAGGKKELFDKVKNKSKEIEYLNFVYNNTDSLYSPIEKRYNFVVNDALSEDNSIIYLNPVLFVRQTEAPFTSPTRVYPVDFGIPYIENYTMNFTIPEGYKIEELPKNKNMIVGNNDGKFIYTIGHVGDRIIANLRFTIEKPIFLPDEYQNLKEFFDRIVANEAEQIVLKKI